MAKRGRPVKPIDRFDIELLERRFVEDKPYAEIARLQGTTRQNIQQKIVRVVEKMAEQVHLL